MGVSTAKRNIKRILYGDRIKLGIFIEKTCWMGDFACNISAMFIGNADATSWKALWIYYMYTPNGFEPLWASIAILWPVFLGGVQCRWVGLDVPWWQRLHGRWSPSSPKLFNKSWGLLSMTCKMEVYKHTEKGLSRPCVCVLSFWAMAIKKLWG